MIINDLTLYNLDIFNALISRKSYPIEINSYTLGYDPSEIGQAAFHYMTGIQRVVLSNCVHISAAAFSYCTNLSYISTPKLTELGTRAFDTTALQSVYFSLVTSLKGWTFTGCSNLSIIDLPNVTTANICDFQSIGQNTNNITINLPNLISMSFSAFSQAYIRNIFLPKLSKMGYYCFCRCSLLSQASFPCLSSLAAGTFDGCTSLSRLYLLSSNICGLYNSAVFRSTPMVNSTYLGIFGSIYVPSSLLANYKAHATWSYFSDRLVGV